MAGATSLFMLATWSGAVLFLNKEQVDAYRETLNETGALSTSFAEQTYWLLLNVEQLSNSLGAEIEGNRQGYDLGMITRRHAIPDIALEAAVVRPDGTLEASSTGGAPEWLDLGDREHIVAHSDQGGGRYEGMFIGKTVSGRNTGRRSLLVSRGLSDPRGAFDGVLLLALDPDLFTRLHARTNVRGASMVVMGDDGRPRASTASSPFDLLKTVDKDLNAYSAPGKDGLEAPGLMDAEGESIQIVATSRVQRYPLTVSIGVKEDVALASWRALAIRTVLGAVAVSVAAVVLALVILTAIRSRSRQRAELALLNEQLSATQRIARLGSWERDTTTGEGRWSVETYRIFGLDPAQPAPSVDDLVSMVHPEDRARWSGFSADLVAGRAGEVEYRLVRPDGDVVHLLEAGEAVQEDGAVVRIRGSVMDISERKAREAELQESRNLAQKAVKVRERFLATMSHEIKTPLTGVLGVVDLLMLEGGLGAEARRLLETLRSSAEGLLGVLSDVLDYSRLSNGRVELETVDFDFWKLLTDAKTLFESGAAAKGVALDLAIDEQVPHWVCGDPSRLRQVVFNLLGNATKFTARGRISVSARASRIEGGRLRVTLAVSDTGIGITEEQLSRLFQPFAQGDASTTRRFGGSGLGLAIVKSVVDALGGEVRVSSKPGEGSTFEVLLTLKEGTPPAEAAAEPSSAAPRRGGPLRVLFADDVNVNRMIVAARFSHAGHEIVTVENGREAVEAVERGGPWDAVILDLHMPVMDGLEAVCAIRRLPVDRIPRRIIALTADADPGVQDACLAGGFDDFIGKPIDFPRLLAALGGDAGSVADGGSPAPATGAGPRKALETLPALTLLSSPTLGDLRATLGEQRLAMILRAGVSGVEMGLARIESALAAGDRAAASVEAHALKGMTANLGATRLAFVFDLFLVEIGRGTDVTELVAALKEVSADTRRAVEQSGIAAARAG
ncbi:ATP-binding protein [Arenibaculum pallidiluteum]|uniref:ATP-binding protein n=1 Tax=Arenibaculum pallidiluteum TaxID=2812559 RepID=UPI001A970B4A|nr:ATP-binding protein [Arenibaculum pallidiluteum]